MSYQKCVKKIKQKLNPSLLSKKAPTLSQTWISSQQNDGESLGYSIVFGFFLRTKQQEKTRHSLLDPTQIRLEGPVHETQMTYGR